MKKTLSFVVLAVFLGALIFASPGDGRYTGQTTTADGGTTATASGSGAAEEKEPTPEEVEKAFLEALKKVRPLASPVAADMIEVQQLTEKLEKDKPEFGKSGRERFRLFREDAEVVKQGYGSLKNLRDNSTFAPAVAELEKATQKFKAQRKRPDLVNEAFDRIAQGKRFNEMLGDNGAKATLTSFGSSGKQLALDLAKELQNLKSHTLGEKPSREAVLTTVAADTNLLNLHIRKVLSLEVAAKLLAGIDEAKAFNDQFVVEDPIDVFAEIVDRSLGDKGAYADALGQLTTENNAVLSLATDVIGDLVSGKDATGTGLIGLSAAKAHSVTIGNLVEPLGEIADTLEKSELYGGTRAKIVLFTQGLYGFDLVLKSVLNLADPGLTMNMDGFVHDQIRLFYFAEVGKLMRTLNPLVQEMKMTQKDLAGTYSGLRGELLTAQTDVAVNQHRLRELKLEQAALQAKIDAINRKAEAADDRYIEERKRSDKAGDVLSGLEKEKAALVDDEEAAEPEDKEAITNKIAAKDEEIAAATAEKEIRKKHADTAEEEAKRSGVERDRLRSRDSNLPKEFDNAKTAANSAQEALMTARIKARGTGQAEVEAFAEMRDNQPFLVSRPIPGSGDPVHRVLLYGYPNSNTLFIRGTGDDVRVVKEIIAGFDAPAPQAKINLYTLQINGTSNAKLDKTVAAVNAELRELSSNISMLEDDLRFSLTAEVKRVATVCKKAVGSGALAISDDRLFRYFYYPQEIRRRLGCRITIPTERRLAESAAADKKAAQNYLAIAEEIWKSASQQKPGRRIGANEAEDLRGQAYQYLQSAAERIAFARLAMEGIESAGKEREVSPSNVAVAQTQLVSFKAFEESLAVATPDKINFVDLRQKLGAVNTDVAFPSDLPYMVVDNGLNSVLRCTKWTLPDPANGTTLGEMILNITLGRKSSRQRIVRDFVRRANARYSALIAARDTQVKGRASKQTVQEANSQDALRRFVDAIESATTSGMSAAGILPGFPGALLGSDPVVAADDDAELSSNQLEILLALETKARETAASEVRWLLRQMYSDKSSSENFALATIRQDYKTLLGWLAESFQATDPTRRILWQKESLNAKEVKKESDIFALVPDDSKEGLLHISPSPLEDGQAKTFEEMADRLLEDEERRANGGGNEGVPEPDTNADYELVKDRRAWQIATMMATRNSLARSTPRVAAADHMLHNLMGAVERDLDKYFIQDAFDQIREAIRSNGVRFGALEHESILATNRLIARVDPNANADFELAQGTDFVQAATQLGNFLGVRKDALNSGATATALGVAASGLEGQSLGALNPWSIGGFLGALSFLNDSQPDQRGDVYSINSGNLFKVTPIFDPSGQALRFRFDYQASTFIQEPNGTTNRAVPQVNRHAVNTEVQLGNLQFGEISRFGLNAKLGTPDERRGGIPLIKDLPVIRDIPLLGYFFRRRGSDAVRQESLIFAQTTIYPTISDIVNLAVNKSPHDDLMEPAPKGLFPDKYQEEKRKKGKRQDHH